MKKILFALMALALVSCGKQGIEPEPEPAKEARYSFCVVDDMFQTLAQQYGPMDVTIYLSEYKGKQKVAVNEVTNPGTGTYYFFTANENAEYVTVYTVVERKSDGTKATQYIANAFYLKAGETIKIDLSKTTPSSKKEPIAE